MEAPLAHVFYESCYGSTQQYATELATQLGTTAQPIDGPIPDDGLPVILMSYVHGLVFPAEKYYDVLTETMTTPLPFRVAVVKVGMEPVETGQEKCKVEGTAYAEFYLRGRLNYSEISRKHYAALSTVAAALRLKPRKSVAEKEFLNIFNKDTDQVDFRQLEPIVQWVING